MKLQWLSKEAQEGLRKWAAYQHGDDMLFDSIGSLPEPWAWITYQLAAADDRPAWFPKGKWATIQVIEEFLDTEAEAEAEVKPEHLKKKH